MSVLLRTPLVRVRRLAVVLALATVAGAGLAVTPADAVTGSVLSGRPGSVTVRNAPMLLAWDTQFVSYGVPLTFRNFDTQGAIAYRSPATSGAQTVTARYFLQRWTGQWTNWRTSDTYSGVLSGGTTSISFPRWQDSPASQPIGENHYRIVYAMNWYDSLGRNIGFMEVFHNRVGETKCATKWVRCTPSPGWITMS
jgi:hypothetical protein